MIKFAIAALTLTALSCSAQSPLRIRLIDGKSGKALTPSSIRVAATPAETPRYLIPATDPASVLVYLKSAASFTVSQQFVRCDVDPKATSAPPPAHLLRRRHPRPQRPSRPTPARGPKSKLTSIAKPKPGELVLYVRRATPLRAFKKSTSTASTSATELCSLFR